MPLPNGSSETIKRWFHERKLPVPDDFIPKIETFRDLVLEWSSRINIVSKSDLNRLLERHILDSLTPIKAIPDKGRLIDIGSGAGLPSIPLAIMRPFLRITTIESRHKKILFLKEVRKRLAIANLDIVETRLEEYRPESLFDLATVRALPRWRDHTGRIKSLLAPTGKIIFYEKPGKYKLI
jgi:16S rRNA (guanine527-N7)-methyltransferase